MAGSALLKKKQKEITRKKKEITTGRKKN